MQPNITADQLIHEQNLRIVAVLPVKEIDLLLVVLNNQAIIKSPLSTYKLLRHATQEQLNAWQIRHKGTALRWDELDEDLSLRGFLTNGIISQILQHTEKGEKSMFVV